jgi:AcrR family transcriptional regulator
LKTPKTAAENTGVSTRTPRATRGKGRPKQEDSEETLRTVYHVAYAHFIVNGIEGASMQAIAREAGVSRQMIHNRFGNKEQFFRTVLERGEDTFANRFAIAALPSSRDPWVIFDYLGHTIFNILTDARSMDLFRVMNIALYRHPDIATYHSQSLENAYRMIAGYLAMCAKEMGVKVETSREAAMDFVSLIQGLAQPIIQGRAEIPDEKARKKTIRGVVKRYLRGVGFPDRKRQ